MACIYGVEQSCDECRMCRKEQDDLRDDVGKAILCDCDGCKNNDTDECMHCMRAYTDCYESEGQGYERSKARDSV